MHVMFYLISVVIAWVVGYLTGKADPMESKPRGYDSVMDKHQRTVKPQQQPERPRHLR